MINPVLKRALDTWGEQPQMLMVVEEMAEFLTYYRWICSDCPEDKLVYCSWECEKHRREWLMKEHEMRIGSEFEKVEE